MQDTLFPQFALYRLRLLLELGAGRQMLPAYLGSTVRGLFAASFRHLVCVTQAPVCDGCTLLHRCPYPYVFETPPLPHLPDVLQKRFRQAPRPYIFEVPMTYAGEETLELGLVFVGRALDFLPYFLYVVQETGKRGFGRIQVPYRLLSVTDASQAARIDTTKNSPCMASSAHSVSPGIWRRFCPCCAWVRTCTLAPARPSVWATTGSPSRLPLTQGKGRGEEGQKRSSGRRAVAFSFGFSYN